MKKDYEKDENNERNEAFRFFRYFRLFRNPNFFISRGKRLCPWQSSDQRRYL